MNGKSVGNLPLDKPVRVAEGPVQVGLRALGHAPATTTVTVDGGKRAQVNLALKPGVDPGPGATAGPTPVPGPGTDYRAPLAGTPGADASTSASTGSARLGAASRVGGHRGGGAGGVGGHLRGAVATGGQADFDEYMAPGATMPSCFTALPDKGGAKCKEYYNRAESARKVAIGGFVAGGALAAGAIIGFVLSSGGTASGAWRTPSARTAGAPAARGRCDSDRSQPVNADRGRPHR